MEKDLEEGVDTSEFTKVIPLMNSNLEDGFFSLIVLIKN